MTAETSGTAASLPPSVRGLAPSAKLVAKVLEQEGELTQARLAEETLLPPRTVRHALTQLEEASVVTSRISLMDTRQRIYALDARTGG